HEFCDYYLEYVKYRIYETAKDKQHSRRAAQYTLYTIYSTVIEQQISSERGKGEAFLQGLLYVKNSGADIILTLDADLTGQYGQFQVNALLDKLRYRHTDMAIYPVREGDHSYGYGDSGQRAIRLTAINFLFKKNPAGTPQFILSEIPGARRFREMASGYGLERALDEQIKNAVGIIGKSERGWGVAELEFAPAFRGERLERQKRDARQTCSMIKTRRMEIADKKAMRNTLKTLG
ncbi:MAG: hypothetical protein M1530_01190, partial [Candidatus Marsarchaeota archaeon]|nr:hypothetical protein [Candidatus Marsarchaeota archaeon]